MRKRAQRTHRTDPAANLMHVPRKLWAKWPRTARLVYNETYCTIRDGQGVMQHPKAPHVGREKWRTLAHNVAFTAAFAVKRWVGVVLLVLAIATPAAAQNLKCFGSFKVTANGTYPTDKPVIMDGAGNTVSVYLGIQTAGAGALSVAAYGYGPPASKVDTAKTHRAQWLIGTLDAVTTAIDTDVKTPGVDFVVAGCTSCVAWLSVCTALP